VFQRSFRLFLDLVLFFCLILILEEKVKDISFHGIKCLAIFLVKRFRYRPREDVEEEQDPKFSAAFRKFIFLTLEKN